MLVSVLWKCTLCNSHCTIWIYSRAAIASLRSVPNDLSALPGGLQFYPKTECIFIVYTTVKDILYHWYSETAPAHETDSKNPKKEQEVMLSNQWSNSYTLFCTGQSIPQVLWLNQCKLNIWGTGNKQGWEGKDKEDIKEERQEVMGKLVK